MSLGESQCQLRPGSATVQLNSTTMLKWPVSPEEKRTQFFSRPNSIISKRGKKSAIFRCIQKYSVLKSFLLNVHKVCVLLPQAKTRVNFFSIGQADDKYGQEKYTRQCREEVEHLV